jgi:hypothetical protein
LRRSNCDSCAAAVGVGDGVAESDGAAFVGLGLGLGDVDDSVPAEHPATRTSAAMAMADAVEWLNDALIERIPLHARV